MRSLPSLLIVAALALAAVLAADAGAEPGGQPSPAVTVVGAGPRGAKPRLSKAIAVSKPHRKHRAHKKPGQGVRRLRRRRRRRRPRPPGQAPLRRHLRRHLVAVARRPVAREPPEDLDPAPLRGERRRTLRSPARGRRAADGRQSLRGQRADLQRGQESIFVRDEIRIPSGYSYTAPGSWSTSCTSRLGRPRDRHLHRTQPSDPLRPRLERPDLLGGPILELERWYTLVYHVYLSNDPKQGYVELWWNGVQQTLTNGSTRMYGETIYTTQTYIKAGIYRSPSKHRHQPDRTRRRRRRHRPRRRDVLLMTGGRHHRDPTRRGAVPAGCRVLGVTISDRLARPL